MAGGTSKCTHVFAFGGGVDRGGRGLSTHWGRGMKGGGFGEMASGCKARSLCPHDHVLILGLLMGLQTNAALGVGGRIAAPMPPPTHPLGLDPDFVVGNVKGRGYTSIKFAKRRIDSGRFWCTNPWVPDPLTTGSAYVARSWGTCRVLDIPGKLLFPPSGIPTLLTHMRTTPVSRTKAPAARLLRWSRSGGSPHVHPPPPLPSSRSHRR